MSTKTMDVNELAFLAQHDQDLVHRISRTCYRKCVASFEKDQLSFGEQNCLDRCTYKFTQVHKMGHLAIRGLLPDFSSEDSSTHNV